MNEQIFKGKWNQLKGEVQKEWGKLTNNDVDQIEGELTRLKGTIQVKYGQTKEEVDQKVNEFVTRFNEQKEEVSQKVNEFIAQTEQELSEIEE